MTVSAVAAGYIAVGDIVTGPGVTSGTRVTAVVSGSVFTVTPSQTVGSATSMLTVGVAYGATNYVIPNHSVYVAAVGGLASDIGQAIWNKKDLGCDTIGNTTTTVVDNVGYNYPYPTYTIKYNVPTNTPIKFAVQITNTPAVPSNIVALVQQAIIAQFTGQTGTTPERIGGSIYASRYFPAVSGVAANISVVSILVGTSTPTLNNVNIGIDQKPTITATDISVTLV
jgi:hypothetical protein